MPTASGLTRSGISSPIPIASAISLWVEARKLLGSPYHRDSADALMHAEDILLHAFVVEFVVEFDHDDADLLGVAFLEFMRAIIAQEQSSEGDRTNPASGTVA
jgi:hypothetical protein